MPKSHALKTSELDSEKVEIHFSPELKRAYGDLAAAVHFSEYFDPDIQAILRRWSATRAPTLHDVLIALPLIARETFSHIRATGDERAQEAWQEICNNTPEKGFTLTKSPGEKRHR
jgi:hypothetical protein